MNKIKFKTKLILCVTLINFLTLFLSYLIFIDTKVKDDTKNIRINLYDVARLVSLDPQIKYNLENKILDKKIDEKMDHYISIFKDTDIIVVADTTGLKYSHLIKEQIGTHFVNPVNWDVIKKGEGYFSTMKGSVGITTRRFEPILDSSQNLIGFVMVGKYNYLIDNMTFNTIIVMMMLFGVSLTLAFIMSVFFAGGVKKSMFGLEPEEIGKLHIKEKLIVDNLESGLIVLDDTNKILDVNKVFYKKFLSLTPEIIVNATKIFLGGKKIERFDIAINKQIYHVKILPIYDDKRYYGNMLVVKTREDVDSYAREITGIDQLIEGMRASIHEFKNRLHVILGLINLGKIEMVKKYIMDFQELNEYDFRKYQNIHNPFFKAMLLGKEAICKERKIEFRLEPGSNLNIKEQNRFVEDITAVIGNLIENSIEAFNECNVQNKIINIGINHEKDHIKITVSDNGKKIPEEIKDKIYSFGFSTKGEHRGVGLYLIIQKLKLYDGTIHLITDKEIKTFQIEVKYEEGNCN